MPERQITLGDTCISSTGDQRHERPLSLYDPTKCTFSKEAAISMLEVDYVVADGTSGTEPQLNGHVVTFLGRIVTPTDATVYGRAAGMSLRHSDASSKLNGIQVVEGKRYADLPETRQAYFWVQQGKRLLRNEPADLDPMPPADWLNAPGSEITPLRNPVVPHACLSRDNLIADSRAESTSIATSAHAGPLEPDLIGVAHTTVGDQLTRAGYLTGEIKLREHELKAGMARELCYALELYEMCGAFGGLVIIGRRFLRCCVLDSRLIAIEGLGIEGETTWAVEEMLASLSMDRLPHELAPGDAKGGWAELWNCAELMTRLVRDLPISQPIAKFEPGGGELWTSMRDKVRATSGHASVVTIRSVRELLDAHIGSSTYDRLERLRAYRAFLLEWSILGEDGEPDQVRIRAAVEACRAAVEGHTGGAAGPRSDQRDEDQDKDKRGGGGPPDKPGPSSSSSGSNKRERREKEPQRSSRNMRSDTKKAKTKGTARDEPGGDGRDVEYVSVSAFAGATSGAQQEPHSRESSGKTLVERFVKQQVFAEPPLSPSRCTTPEFDGDAKDRFFGLEHPVTDNNEGGGPTRKRDAAAISMAWGKILERDVRVAMVSPQTMTALLEEGVESTLRHRHSAQAAADDWSTSTSA